MHKPPIHVGGSSSGSKFLFIDPVGKLHDFFLLQPNACSPPRRRVRMIEDGNAVECPNRRAPT